MAELFIPVLHWFDAGNIFTGSCGDFRFRIRPNIVKLTPKEVDFEKSTIVAEFWHGAFCYEKSEMEGHEVFPMSEEGRTAMKSWLEAHI